MLTLPRWAGRRGALALTLAGYLLAAACATTTQGPTEPANTIHILAGSELKDLEPLLPQIDNATGLHLALTYSGTLDGAERIMTGDRSDLAWFSSGKYLTLLQGSSGRVVAQERTMLSPVILGVKHSTATRLGWVGNPNVTWRDVAVAAHSGQFHFAMTDPSASNSGFSALVGVASAFAGSGNALQSGDINAGPLRDFFSGQALTAGSSGFLADSFVRSEASLDGIINYESVLLSLNSGGRLKERLDLLYPKEGIITADYPLMLLNTAKRAAYDKLLGYLRSPSVQQQLMTRTARRPALPEVALDSRFTTQVLVELPFPSSLDVVNKLLLTYLNEIRLPSYSVFVLDMSGSMEGDRINGLKRALRNLTGLDTSISGQFASFRNRETVVLVLFSDHIIDTRPFTIDASDPTTLDALRHYIDGLQAGGGTAIYDAVAHAYDIAGAAKAGDPKRFYSIVLMTDGENNAGRSATDFLRDYGSLPPDTRAIKTFAVLFGEASPSDLQRLASATGGRVFDSRNTPLSTIFKEIRGYQ
jgi:Ca-activated chloride channel family protein